MNKSKMLTGYIYAVVSAVIYGCMPLMANYIYADGVSPMTLVFLRNVLALPVLAPGPGSSHAVVIVASAPCAAMTFGAERIRAFRLVFSQRIAAVSWPLEPSEELCAKGTKLNPPP